MMINEAAAEKEHSSADRKKRKPGKISGTRLIS